MSERTHLTRSEARNSALRIMADADQARAEDVAAERNPLIDFIEEQRADRAAFKAKTHRKLQSLERQNRIAWLYGAVGWILAALMAIFMGVMP